VIGITARGLPSDTSGLAGTKLVEDIPFPPQDSIRKPRENLSALIEELHSNVTLSLFSLNNLVYLEPVPGTPVTTIGYVNVFHYNLFSMVLTYGIALALGLFALLVGAQSYLANGVGMGLGFLSILVTTRNPRLDDLACGSCLGAEPMPGELTKVKLRFGDIPTKAERQSSGHGHPWAESPALGRRMLRHAGFGVDGEVRKLSQDEHYA
jgi:hypothetical protein